MLFAFAEPSHSDGAPDRVEARIVQPLARSTLIGAAIESCTLIVFFERGKRT